MSDAVREAAQAFVDHLEHWESRSYADRLRLQYVWRPRSHELYEALRKALEDDARD